jgi:hypothetical protein
VIAVISINIKNDVMEEIDREFLLYSAFIRKLKENYKLPLTKQKDFSESVTRKF